MKRHLSSLAAAVLVASLASPAFATGNVKFLSGERAMDDEAAWGPFGDQELSAADVDFSMWGSPVQFGAGFQSSQKRKSFSGSDLTLGVREIYFGVNKIWNVNGRRMHPFVGGGGVEVMVWRKFRGTAPDDRSHGYYAHGGVFWRLGRYFDIGFDGRTVWRTHLSLSFVDFNANYHQLAFLLGWGWPAGK